MPTTAAAPSKAQDPPAKENDGHRFAGAGRTTGRAPPAAVSPPPLHRAEHRHRDPLMLEMLSIVPKAAPSDNPRRRNLEGRAGGARGSRWLSLVTVE